MSSGDVIRIPVVDARAVWLRCSPLPRTADFDPGLWRHEPLTAVDDVWWEIDLAALALSDGDYEYDFKIDRAGATPVFTPDPYAEEIVRFGGYRGVFHYRGGHRYRIPFSWDGELPDGVTLPNNNEMVLYEMPMRWVDAPPDAQDRQVGLGTFDKALFERLAYLQNLGVNAIELLPVQDSPDTLNWGYGTRFFFAPDFDMGAPYDLKLFIKECHRRGIRVILDVVMNHSRACPLETLAHGMFYLDRGDEEPDPNGEPRADWGGRLFRYREPRHGGYHAREFHFHMAEFWIREYHVDGFRLDEFKGIDNWDFIREFRDRAWAAQRRLFPGRPFIVIAEDSWRRPAITQGTVDAMWDFDFRDELRRLVSDNLPTQYGQTARSERVRAMLIPSLCWDDMGKRWREGYFTDMAQRVTYCTSHDVEKDAEQRLLPYFAQILNARGGSGHTAFDAAILETRTAFSQVHAAFALMLTAAGIPMFLAGEEFGDIHDVDRSNWRLKMSDPVEWSRAGLPGHAELLARVSALVRLRARHPALHRNEVEFFGFGGAAGFHPEFDGNDGARVFVYCRNAGQPLGSEGQIVVVANCGGQEYPGFWIDWPWDSGILTEHGGLDQSPPHLFGYRAELALKPFQVRVFEV